MDNLKGFKRFLQNRAGVSEKELPYYINWVTKFRRMTPKTTISQDDVEPFLRTLKRRFESWQITQAGQAVRLWLFYSFRNRDIDSLWKDAADDMKKLMRLQRKSGRTVETYMYWLRRFYIYSGGVKPPAAMEMSDVRKFLEYLLDERRVSSSTQNIAFCALVFFFKQVLKSHVYEDISALFAKKGRKVPSVLSQKEVWTILKHMRGYPELAALLMYGSGMRVAECISLCVEDLDFEKGDIHIKSGKGDKDRIVILPKTLDDRLKKHIGEVKQIREQDRKANIVWDSNWLFPSPNLTVESNAETARRHCMNRSAIQKAFHRAAEAAGIDRPVSLHTLRHSFATHMLEMGNDIRYIQELLGHSSVRTTMVYLHTDGRSGRRAESPLNTLDKMVEQRRSAGS